MNPSDQEKTTGAMHTNPTWRKDVHVGWKAAFRQSTQQAQ